MQLRLVMHLVFNRVYLFPSSFVSIKYVSVNISSTSKLIAYAIIDKFDGE